MVGDRRGLVRLHGLVRHFIVASDGVVRSAGSTRRSLPTPNSFSLPTAAKWNLDDVKTVMGRHPLS